MVCIWLLVAVLGNVWLYVTIPHGYSLQPELIGCVVAKICLFWASECWQEDPLLRPTFVEIEKRLARLDEGHNMIDTLFAKGTLVFPKLNMTASI